MQEPLPQVVVSRDGQRAVRLERFGVDLHRSLTTDGFPLDTIVTLRSRGARSFLRFVVDNMFRMTWGLPSQTKKWDESFAVALPSLALIALGRFLDEHEIPPDPTDEESGIVVPVNGDLYEIFDQASATDDELFAYVRGKIHWSYAFDCEPTRFEPWEAYRLGVVPRDLERAAFPETDRLWRRTDQGYVALPAFVRGEATVARVQDHSTKALYDVALSFAGEQREYVRAVADALKVAGASVFYDEYAGLWGKDLSIELQRVYQTDSRFVVVFVSQAYIEKPWTNLERQHALVGRMNRLDDSVLPARFDAIKLPGLPETVAYLDIGDRSPAELAGLIFERIRTAK